VSAAPQYELAVLIASHQRRERLRRCLDALAAQTLDPGDFEVIVADDASSDGTAAAVEAYADTAPFRLRVLRLAKMGKPAALNEAIAACEARVCLFLDDDVIAAPQLLAEHLAAAQEHPRALALGKLIQRQPSDDDWFAHAYTASWNQRYEELASKRPDWADCYGANFSVPLEALREVGGFNASLGAVEDIELGHRLGQAGCTPIYLPAAEALHDDEKTRGRILGDIVGFGEFCAEFGERHPDTRGRLLGWFLETTPREALLRRLILALRLPPRLIAAPGRLLPDEGRRQVWFGLVSKYAFWLGVRKAMSRRRWLETTRGVPVLLYHAFTDSGEDDTYVLPRRSFARQMRLLARLRFRVISAEELVLSLREGRMPPRRSAVITIDDGYADNFEIAYPELRRHHFPATVYMVSRGIGKRNEWNDAGAASGRPLLSLEQLRSMQEDGIQIGSHTQTHCSLPGAPAEIAAREIRDSRADLEANEMTATTFAYPYGQLDDRIVELVGEAGYVGAYASHVPVRAGLGSDPLQVPRIEIVGDESTFTFLRKLLIGGL
jgi:GT2 family glycosyltransferase/peptidoglycan/xylan/chitin deacetylase (PgdA/CDA1 family)